MQWCFCVAWAASASHVAFESESPVKTPGSRGSSQGRQRVEVEENRGEEDGGKGKQELTMSRSLWDLTVEGNTKLYLKFTP